MGTTETPPAITAATSSDVEAERFGQGVEESYTDGVDARLDDLSDDALVVEPEEPKEIELTVTGNFAAAEDDVEVIAYDQANSLLQANALEGERPRVDGMELETQEINFGSAPTAEELEIESFWAAESPFGAPASSSNMPDAVEPPSSSPPSAVPTSPLSGMEPDDFDAEWPDTSWPDVVATPTPRGQPVIQASTEAHPSAEQRRAPPYGMPAVVQTGAPHAAPPGAPASHAPAPFVAPPAPPAPPAPLSTASSAPAVPLWARSAPPTPVTPETPAPAAAPPAQSHPILDSAQAAPATERPYVKTPPSVRIVTPRSVRRVTPSDIRAAVGGRTRHPTPLPNLGSSSLAELEEVKEAEPWLSSGSPSTFGSGPAERVAMALERVAARVRSGEIAVPGAMPTDEGALAVVLAAMLAAHRQR